jgi:hypothetical protein
MTPMAVSGLCCHHCHDSEPGIASRASNFFACTFVILASRKSCLAEVMLRNV